MNLEVRPMDNSFIRLPDHTYVNCSVDTWDESNKKLIGKNFLTIVLAIDPVGNRALVQFIEGEKAFDIVSLARLSPRALPVFENDKTFPNLSPSTICGPVSSVFHFPQTT